MSGTRLVARRVYFAGRVIPENRVAIYSGPLENTTQIPDRLPCPGGVQESRDKSLTSRWRSVWCAQSRWPRAGVNGF